MRLLEPFTAVELRVYVKSAPIAGPFSCRVYGDNRQVERTTVIRILPDTDGPVIQRVDTRRYFDHIERTLCIQNLQTKLAEMPLESLQKVEEFIECL
jgi:hypothetical protein